MQFSGSYGKSVTETGNQNARNEKGIMMIELNHDTLIFSFPEVHPEARLEITFQRTLRIPDDNKEYPLPPGLGKFPLRHVDDYAATVQPTWLEHGGIMLPMYQSEAMWLNFDSAFLPDHEVQYPFAVKIAAGKINAVTGKEWTDFLQISPQDYMVTSEQPWLDGYCVDKGLIRQFVAMPLGSGYTAEEQITGAAEFGGLQIIVYPMKRDVFERRFPKVEREMMRAKRSFGAAPAPCAAECSEEMGLAPGGMMRQEIYADPFGINDWDINHKSRCYTHIANSLTWRAVTGDNPPTVPLTSKEYNDHGMPWFDFYNDSATPLNGSTVLNSLKSIVQMGKIKKDNPLPENQTVTPESVVALRKGMKQGQVREGTF